MKKLLSLLLSISIILGMFGCFTMIASAEDENETWKSGFIATDFSGNTENIYNDNFYANNNSTDTVTIESNDSFDLSGGFGVYANLTMSNSAAYLSEGCSMKVGNVALNIKNVKNQNNYLAEIMVGDKVIGTADLSSAPNGKYRLYVNEKEIWAALNYNTLTFTNDKGNEVQYLSRPDDVNLSDAHLSFSISGNGSGATSRYWSNFLLHKAPATKYIPKDVYITIADYNAAEENAYFALPERTIIYTGDRIHMNYNAWTAFTWPDGHTQTEWNMASDTGQVGQPQNGYYYTFLNEGEHYIKTRSISPECKLVTFDVVDSFYAPTSAQVEESTDTTYPDGSSLPFTDKLVSGDKADFYNNPVEEGVYFTSDLWQAVPLVSQEILELGYSGGEGCQLINSVAYGNDGKLAFLGTDVGGIYKSVDGGANWYPCTVGFKANGATSITVDPKNNNKVLCVGASSGYDSTNGIIMSTDAGETWKLVFSVDSIDDGTVGAHGDNRRQIAFDPTSYDEKLGYCKTIYWSRENNTTDESCNNPSIYKSTDGGYTWKVIENTRGLGGQEIRISADTGWVFISTSDGILRSKDGCATWETVFDDWGKLDTVNTYPSNVYVINRNGYHVSTDYGETWDSFKGNNCFTEADPMVFSVSPANPKNAIVQYYIGSYNYKTFITNDEGYNWSGISIDYTGLWHETTGASVYAFAWNPVHKNTVLLAGWGGMFKSINGGSNFFYSNSGFNSLCGGGEMNFNVNDSNLISIASQDFNGGYSIDGGKTWRYVNWAGKNWGGFTYGSYILDKDTIITGVATSMGGNETYIYVTQDGGKTITNTGVRVYGKKIGFGAIGNNDIAFLGEYRTTDGGLTFNIMPNCAGVYTADITTGRLFGINGGDVVTSIDDGATWTTLCATGMDYLSDVAYSPSSNTLYVTNGANLYVCNPDFNSSENKVTRRAFGESYADTVAVDPSNDKVVYVGCSSVVNHDVKAIWRSLDGGVTWTCLTRAAGDGRECADGGKQPLSIRVNANTGELFVLTGCRGVWKIAAPPQWYLDANIVPGQSFNSLKEMVVNDIVTNTTYSANAYSDNDIYYIYTKEDLNNVRNHMHALHILMNDIEFTDADFAPGGDFYNNGSYWQPYAPEYKSTAFTGIFYGNGYTIKGLKSSTNAIYASMFGCNKGLIMKTGFVDCEVKGNNSMYVALVAGQNYGKIINCYIKNGRISGSGTHRAMFAGFGYADGISGCYVDGSFESSGYPLTTWAISLGSYPSTPNYFLNTMADYGIPDDTEGKTGTGLSKKNMKKQASYVGWDFENVWEINEGKDTPTLRHFVFNEEKPETYLNFTENSKKLNLGTEYQATAIATDENGEEIKADTYFYTTTPDIVTVTETGKITTLSEGTGYVYVVDYNTNNIARLTVKISLVTLFGDADCNGTLNSLDLLKAQQQILGYGEISGTGWYNCDTNSDNKIDATDLTAIQMVIVGLATIES